MKQLLTSKLTTMEKPAADDEAFLRARVPFLSGAEVSALKATESVGDGAFGSVDLVQFKGQKAVRKVLKAGNSKRNLQKRVDMLLWEARVLVELDGAGGAPHLLAVSTQPPGAILEYAGQTYCDFLNESCSVGDFLDTLVSLTHCLGEVGEQGFLHNDLKANNVTVTHSDSGPVIHLIDFGLTTRVGESFPFDFFGLIQAAMKKQRPQVRSIELTDGKPLLPSSDVFSLGRMLIKVLAKAKSDCITGLMKPLLDQCTNQDPSKRPSLPQVAAAVTLIKEQVPNALLKDQLLIQEGPEP